MTSSKQPVRNSGARLTKVVVAAGVALISTSASAIELARVEGFGPVSRGFAGAGVAHAVGAGSMMLNPAELLRLDSEHEALVQLTQVHARIDIDNRATGETVRNAGLGNNRGPYHLPELAYAWRTGDWAFGTGVFAAGGFGIEYGTQSFLSRTTTNNVATGLPVNSRVAQLRIPFAVAFKPDSRWRLGASIDVVNASLNLASLLDAQQVGLLIQSGRASGNLVPVLAAIPDLSGAHFEFVRNNALASELAAWGVAGRIGASFQLSPQTSVAGAYEFKSALRNLKGRGQLTAIDKDNNHIRLEGDGSLPAFQFPQAFVLGVSHRITPQMAVTADLRRTLWGQVLGDTVVDFRSDSGGTLSVSLPTGFNNLTTLAVGAEWQWQSSWTLRAGASHAFQPAVPSDHLSGTFPTFTRNHLSTGLSYRHREAHQFDLGLSYGFTDPVRNPGGNVNSIPAIEGRNRQINPVIGYSYHF